MPLENIKSRFWEVIPFDRSRIERAIELACNAVGETERSFIPVITDFIVKDLEHVFGEIFVNRIPSVEDVQDIVERNLVKFNKFSIAKEYIIYRSQQQNKRDEKQEELVRQFEKNALKVTKSDGSREGFNVKKLKSVFDRAVTWYEEKCSFDELMEAFKKNIIDDIKTSDLSKLLVKTCLDLITVENIAWQEVAWRIALWNVYKLACRNRNISLTDIYSPASYKSLFDEYIKNGLYYKDFYKYYTEEDILEAGSHIKKNTDLSYGYTTILSLQKRYLLNPNKVVKELPQEMYMSNALFLAIPEPKENRLKFALEIYRHCSEQRISLPTPTLINARTNHHQLSSCFKINMDDDLRGIYHAVENMAQISKFGGWVGVYLGNIRSRGGFIRWIEGASGGVNPWVKVINDTAIAVNQLGARLGAISVTLDIWHRDIYDFLDLQTETGDIRAKAFDIFPAVSIPGLFMKRVKEDGDWTLFDPNEIRSLYKKAPQDFFGEEFNTFYEQLEADTTIRLRQTVKAKDLFKKFLKTTVETGMPYVFFRDTVNQLNPNKHAGNIYSTQLCTEICQNTKPAVFKEETIENGEIVIKYTPGDLVVCNLASINIAKVFEENVIAEVFPVMMRILDNVITLNFYPIKEAELTALRYRSVGVGYLGLAEYLATHGFAYDSAEARTHVDAMFEKYAYYTYRASADLAKERGSYELFEGSEYQKGILLGQNETYYTEHYPHRSTDWQQLFADMQSSGVRFGYHSAPAPNTSTAGIVGTTAALLPIYKKYFVETNLSSPTVRVAPKLDSSNFWLYKEYVNMDMNDVIDMISVVYKWIDQSISFEWMIDPAKVSPAELFGYYMKAWEQGIKTVYYVRSLSAEIKDNCVSCSG